MISLVAKKIFISYCSSDAVIAQRIAAALEVVGLSAWVDRREIRPGDSFVERMSEGLEEASYVLLLVSEAASASRWVRREWMSALAASGTVIIPVLIDGCEVPILLRDIVHVDLRQDQQRGIEQIVSFFRTERQELTPYVHTRGIQSLLRRASRRQLRLIALRCIDETALRSFCFDAGVDPVSLGGTNLHEKLVSLLHLAASEGLLIRFRDWMEAERLRCVKNQIRELEKQPGWEWHVESMEL
jgi:hypothetical protein